MMPIELLHARGSSCVPIDMGYVCSTAAIGRVTAVPEWSQWRHGAQEYNENDTKARQR